jgi:hypothetical protein
MVIIAVILIALWGFFLLLIWVLLSSDIPSSGIWQYEDDDLEIIIYVPKGGGINILDGCLKCKAEISYKGEKQKAIIVYHPKMYQYYIKYVYSYDNIMKPDVEISRIGEIISSTYHIKNGKWELKDIRTSEDFLKDYDGKSLILKKIGKYKESE